MQKDLVVFDYPDQATAAFCSDRAERIRAAGRKAVADLVEVGRCLIEVKSRLGHGLWLAWLDAHFGWTPQTASFYMRLAGWAERESRILEFYCLDAVRQFVELPASSQQAILESGAYRRADSFKRVAWESSVRAHLEDREIPQERRLGDAWIAIQEAAEDPVLREAALGVYEQYRQEFARLSESTPTETDVESRLFTSPVALKGTENHLRLVEGDRLAIFEYTEGQGWTFRSNIERWIEMDGEVLFAMPNQVNGPYAHSLQTDGVRTLCRKLQISSPFQVGGQAQRQLRSN